MKNVVIVIPARFGSKRLPGKPLLKLAGKTIIQHVYENASLSKFAKRVIVATDDQRIFDAVRKFNGECVLTPRSINSGTDRVAYAVKNIDCSIVMNLQGDEPFLTSGMFDRGIESALKTNNKTDTFTLASGIETNDELNDTNNVKVVMDKDGYALYFSRFPIPYIRDDKGKLVKKIKSHYRHIGIYIYRPSVLFEFVKLRQSNLERMERLEQLRLIENGYRIKVVVTKGAPPGIDTLQDLKRAERYLKEKGKI
ncbi:MAG: 3-deoxy-manno-octulosonate cytidylyltransferase [Deltaproteobacteria bacterium]|nr:3-deoxy-manno-octulosonate cytidylyltransferase [Deltaproteobacteria bacterium]MCL5792773.1 3-deoxy-manno-octulosonate cytidylyltransferase [Deltaproteobacteria bacterium]